MSQRAEEAKRLFLEGYNCSQSVAAAYADAFGIEKETMLRLSASFGGGIGRMRKTCGAACGMFLIAGLKTGSTDGKDQEAKGKNYAVVRQMADAFRKENGSITCQTLLGLRRAEASAMPSERTADYYASRPCLKMVEDACRIIEEFFPDLA
ncbi:MAG: C-GCAxxG-C-C family protein [Eubacteriales bacterium]|nr:C-GCAxxG-C-C family protein [Eubacteriales bacterium]